MADEREKRIRQLAWVSHARKERDRVVALMPMEIRPWIVFLDNAESSSLGAIYWGIAKGVRESRLEVESLTDAVRRYRWPETDAIWFHRLSNECGAICVKLQLLTRDAESLHGLLGPDFLFMERTGQFGFCYEEAEDGVFLRHWGLS